MLLLWTKEAACTVLQACVLGHLAVCLCATLAVTSGSLLVVRPAQDGAAIPPGAGTVLLIYDMDGMKLLFSIPLPFLFVFL